MNRLSKIKQTSKLTIIILVVLSILLSSCGTSQSAIETAIAQTAAAIPTVTLTPEPTATLIPTATPIPTATEVPSPPLLDSFVSVADFGTLADFYQDMPMTVKSLINIDYAEQEYCGLFLSKTEIGEITICLYEFKDTPLAKSVVSLQEKEFLKSADKITIPSTSKIPTPSNFWAIDHEDAIYTGCSYNDIVIITKIEMDKTKMDLMTILVIPMFMSVNQINLLKSSGF